MALTKIKKNSGLRKVLLEDKDSMSRIRTEYYAEKIEEDRRRAVQKRPLTIEEKAITEALVYSKRP